MPGTFSSLHYHIVFSTKDRFPWVNPQLQPRLYGYIRGIVRAMEAVSIEIGGVADHVHLLARIPPKESVSDFMRALKSKSSGWIHDNFPEMSKFGCQQG